MSWRTGSTIFLEFWPILESKVKSKKELNQFGEELILLFQKNDVDLDDLLGSCKSLDKLLEAKFGISQEEDDEEGYTGLENDQTVLMRAAAKVAQALNVDFNEDEDCVWLAGRLEEGNTTVNLQLYNWKNKEYSFVLATETPRFLDDGSVEILHKEIKSTLTQNLDVPHLTSHALGLLRSIRGGDFDKVVPLSSTSKDEYLEFIARKPIIKI